MLIDLWAKQSDSGCVYADITWTAYAGSAVPEKHRAVFDVVRQGRDAALEFVRAQMQAGQRPFGTKLMRLVAGDPSSRLWRAVRPSHRSLDRRRGSRQRSQHRWS